MAANGYAFFDDVYFSDALLVNRLTEAVATLDKASRISISICSQLCKQFATLTVQT